MTTALSIQIIVYMVILAFIAFAWGYSKGHKDGLQIGVIRGRSIRRATEKAVK